jgi:hypothetical protein
MVGLRRKWRQRVTAETAEGKARGVDVPSRFAGPESADAVLDGKAQLS